MTPISRILACLPRPLQVPALALIYAAMVAAIVLARRLEYARIIYVDVRAH